MLLDYYGAVLIRKLIRLYQYRDRLQVNSEGKHPNDIIYIIKRQESNVGLISYFTMVLGHIAYAEKKGYIPVVDMQNFPNTYLKNEKIGLENSWEYYFKQPGGVSLEEAYQCKNIVMSTDAPDEWPNAKREFIVYKKLIREKWRNYVKKYIVIQPNVVSEMERQYIHLFEKNDRVLGIKCRGTDYLALKPKGHSVQPSVSAIIKKAKWVMEKYKCNKIFLSTEDKAIFEEISSAFPGRVVTNEQKYYEYDGIHYISDMKSDRPNDAYLQGLEYLVSLLLLTRCDCFIGGRNGGTVGVLLFAEKYEYEYVWNLGRY